MGNLIRRFWAPFWSGEYFEYDAGLPVNIVKLISQIEALPLGSSALFLLLTWFTTDRVLTKAERCGLTDPFVSSYASGWHSMSRDVSQCTIAQI